MIRLYVFSSSKMKRLTAKRALEIDRVIFGSIFDDLILRFFGNYIDRWYLVKCQY